MKSGVRVFLLLMTVGVLVFSADSFSMTDNSGDAFISGFPVQTPPLPMILCPVVVVSGKQLSSTSLPITLSSTTSPATNGNETAGATDVVEGFGGGGSMSPDCTTNAAYPYLCSLDEIWVSASLDIGVGMEYQCCAAPTTSMSATMQWVQATTCP